MAKKTAKKATKPLVKKIAKATTALNKKSGATKTSPSKPVKKIIAPAKKASPKKAAPSKKSAKPAAKANGKANKPVKAVKTAKPVKSAKPVKQVKPVSKSAAKPAKPAAKPSKAPSKPAKAVKPVVASPKKAAVKPIAKPAVKPSKPVKAEKSQSKEVAPKKVKEVETIEAPAPVEKKMTQAQIKAAAKKERDYRNSAEFKATLPVRKRNTEEVFEAYKPKKEVRTSKHIKFELEYFFNASNRLLYEFFSTASGLQDWFADDVRINRDGTLSFFWEGTEQKAKLLFKRDGVVARYKWIEEPSDTYFEFRIEIDDLTGDVAMIITDFAEDQQSVENAKMLWDSQVNALKHAIGAY